MLNNNIEIRKEDGLVKIIFISILYFIFLFPITIPVLHVGTFVIFMTVILGYLILFKGLKAFKFDNSNTSRMVKFYLKWTIFLIFYVTLLIQSFGSGDGNIPIPKYVIMLISLPLFYFFGKVIFKDIKDLMKVLYVGAVIQTCLIYTALLVPVFNLILMSLFPEDAFNTDGTGGMEQAIMDGYHIGYGCFGSTGSLRIAICQIGVFYFLINSKGTRFLGHFAFYLLLSIATTLVSRTGMLISLSGLMVMLFMQEKGIRSFMRLITVAFVLLLLGYVFSMYFSSNRNISEAFQRITFLFENGLYESYFKGYSGDAGVNVIPDISLNTIIGLGVTVGQSGVGIQTITDGGFLRNYSAMGLIVAIVNYLIIFGFFRKSYFSSHIKSIRSVIMFMFIIFVIGEFKQEFIYSTFSMCFIFLILGMLERHEGEYLITN